MTDNKYGEILIIEDDKDINDLLATALSKAGYRTRQAWSGTEGELLLKLEREAYALVLLDLMLPGLSGEELLARIRQMDASLPVIILTAKDELDEKINLLVAGADDYITKPFEIKEVVARVAVQLRHAVADVPSKSGKAGENQTKAENETGQGDTANTYIAGPVKIEHRQLVLDRISRQLYVADNAVDGTQSRSLPYSIFSWRIPDRCLPRRTYLNMPGMSRTWARQRLLMCTSAISERR